MSDLNKMTHIGGVPGIYPGAQSNLNAHTKCERLLGRDGKAHVNNKRGKEKRLNLKKLLQKINETGITFGVWGIQG